MPFSWWKVIPAASVTSTNRGAGAPAGAAAGAGAAWGAVGGAGAAVAGGRGAGGRSFLRPSEVAWRTARPTPSPRRNAARRMMVPRVRATDSTPIGGLRGSGGRLVLPEG